MINLFIFNLTNRSATGYAYVYPIYTYLPKLIIGIGLKCALFRS